jgi:phosphatidylglycerophosphatase A
MSDQSLSQKVFSNPIHFFAFGFGSGLSPKAPGTAGTLAAIPVILLAHVIGIPLWILFMVTTLVGTWLADKSSKDLGVHDHPGIVIDEFAGMMLTLMFVPLTWLSLILGFILFRIFDIWKPWPIGAIDKQVKGGIGIMLDDLLAAIYAGGSLLLLKAFSLF